MSSTKPRFVAYSRLLEKIYGNGSICPDRTGTGRFRAGIGCPSSIVVNLQELFPIDSTRFAMFRGAVAELLWMISGSDNIHDLKKIYGGDLKIWDDWAAPGGSIGPLYATQWRAYRGVDPETNEIVVIDQLATLMENLRLDPYGARHVVTAWNPAALPSRKYSPSENAEHGRMSLAPCHGTFQVLISKLKFSERLKLLSEKIPGGMDADVDIDDNVDPELAMTPIFEKHQVPVNYLSLKVYQRSADMILGVPANLVFYAALTHMLAQCTDSAVGELHWLANLQRANSPLSSPKLRLNPEKRDLFSFELSDFQLEDYVPGPKIEYRRSI